VVWASAYSPDGRQLLTASDADEPMLWDATKGEQLGAFRGHSGWVHAVAFSADGKQVLTGSSDKTAILWDVATRRRTQIFGGRARNGSPEGHSLTVESVAISPDATRVLTGGADGLAVLWDAATGKPLSVLRAHRDEVFAVAFSPDGRQAITGS